MTYKVDWTSIHAANWLKYLGHLRDKPATGIEIGCYEGRSSVWFLENILTHNDSILICVDPFIEDFQKKAHMQPSHISTFLENTKSLFTKIYLKNQTSAEYWCCGFRSSDFIYVDGSHRLVHTATDLVMGWESLKTGGVMIVDDYMMVESNRGSDREPWEDEFEVRAAVNSFIRAYNPAVKELGTQAIMVKKNG